MSKFERKMIPQILHNDNREERLERLFRDMQIQGIREYKLWPIIRDPSRTKSISMGHKQIVRWAKENDLEEILIFEDDIRWGKEGAHDYFMANKPQGDWDLYLGGVYIPYFDDRNNKNRLTGFVGFHCYIVRKKFYDIFLNVPENIDIDRALNGLGDYRLCYPYAAVQYNGWSDNAGKVCNYDMLLAGKEIFGMKTIPR